MKERRKEGIGRDASLLGGEKGEEKRRNLPLLLLGTHARVQKREERSEREEEKKRKKREARKRVGGKNGGIRPPSPPRHDTTASEELTPDNMLIRHDNS